LPFASSYYIDIVEEELHSFAEVYPQSTTMKLLLGGGTMAAVEWRNSRPTTVLKYEKHISRHLLPAGLGQRLPLLHV